MGLSKKIRSLLVVAVQAGFFPDDFIQEIYDRECDAEEGKARPPGDNTKVRSNQGDLYDLYGLVE